MSREQRRPRGLDTTMRSAILGVAGSAVVMTVIALFAFGGRAALGVGLGGAIATVNLYVFAKIGEAFLSRRGRAGAWGVIGALKLGALLGGVWLILRSEIVSSLALVAGYSSLILGITIGTALGRGRDDPPSEDDGADGDTPDR